MTISVARHQFPPEIIRHAVWLYVRFTLSYRDVEDLPGRCRTNVDRRGAGFGRRPDLRPRWRLATSGTFVS